MFVSMKNTGNRIANAREAKGWNQSELARALGVTPQSVQAWESGKNTPRPKRIQELAQALGVSGAFLIGETSNLEQAPVMSGRVPLISWVQAGSWCEIDEAYPAGSAEEWLMCPAAYGPKAFALRVRGESMFDPTGRKSFKDGDIIFIDPDRCADNGSLVVCKLVDSDEATFKQLVIEGSERYLKALNPSWPERIIKINGNAAICGVVIGKFEPF